MTTSQSKALEDLWPIFGIDWSDGSEADAGDSKTDKKHKRPTASIVSAIE